MRVSIRKSNVSLHIDYSISFTNNLVGNNVEFDHTSEISLLIIDLGKNLRTRNKQENGYQDAKEFIKYHGRFKLLGISECYIVNQILNYKQRSPNNKWKLQLKLDAENVFLYDVNLSQLGNALYFNNAGLCK